MVRDLSRLFRPRSIAVIGGGAWCAQVIEQSHRLGFAGPIWPVHPKAREVAGIPAFARLEDLPDAPDAAFVGINREATVEAVAALSRMEAGGAVCFASGFAEAQAEDDRSEAVQARLIAAAGEMPILGPNCYGFINALDGALLWPDQHGCGRVERGVAILTQSSNIAINLTMQRRALPIAYTVTCGNMAQTTQAEIATGLLDDPRVTAIGLHVEGFADLRAWERLACKARDKGVPLVAIKVGRSDKARAATISHTASLAGGDAGAQALLDRLGIARVDDLPSFLETLKLLHATGPLDGGTLAAVSSSGGEASLVADTAHGCALRFPPLTTGQNAALRDVLGPRVALANPLDYHTYIWRDTEAMTRVFSAMTGPEIALTLLIVDYPHTDAADWECATRAALQTRARTGRNVAVVATLPELMPDHVATRLIAGGVVPMHGLREAIGAAQAAVRRPPPCPEPVALGRIGGPGQEAWTLTEAEAKPALARHGLAIPRGAIAGSLAECATEATHLDPPLALKGLGIAHKSEAGAVRLNLDRGEIGAAAADMPSETFLIEEMVQGAVAELLVGITRDPAHGFVLTLAAGGVLTELLGDSASLLLPAARDDVEHVLRKLKVFPLLAGFRGKPGADLGVALDAIEAVQAYALANLDDLEEVEVNPLICTATGAIAADALIRKARP